MRVALTFPRDVSESAIEELLLACHGWLSVAGGGNRTRLAVEFCRGLEGVGVTVSVSEPNLAKRLPSVLSGASPGLACTPAEGPPLRGHFARLSLGTDIGTLRTDLPRPGLASVLAPLTEAPPGTALQLVLTARPEQTRRLLARASRLERGGRSSGFQSLVAAQAGRAQARALREKAAAPLFACTASIVSPTSQSMRELAGALSQVAGTYAPVRRHFTWPYFLTRWQVVTRRHALLPRPRLVNTTELGGLLATAPDGLKRLGIPMAPSRRIAAPSGAVRPGRIIGIDPKGRRVALSRGDSRFHLALLGPTGVGKSTLMVHQVLSAAEAGDGVVAIDPKGDLIEDILRRLPEKRARDVIVIDPVMDRDHPVGLNLLAPAPSQSPAAVADALLASMRDLYSGSWGPRLDDTLYNALITAASRPGATVAELPALYASPRKRAEFLTTLEDPFVRAFWEAYERLSGPERAAITAPVLNKLRPLLRPELAPIVAQSRSTVDLDQVLARRRILLIRIPRGAGLFGALLVARLWQAILRRGDRPPGERPDVLLAIDEVQSFLRTGGDVGEALAVARGLGVGLCLATQHLEQCPPALRAAHLANARSRVVFQSDAEDARVLARGFAPELEAVDLMGLPRFEVAARLAVDGAVSRPFTARTVPLPDPIRSSSRSLRRMSRHRYGRPRGQVLAEIAVQAASGGLGAAPIGEVGLEEV